MIGIVVNQDGNTFRAISGKKHSVGKTIGEAVDALVSQFSNDEKETLFISPHFQPDEFFTLQQQERLSQLMEKLRLAENENKEMNAEERAELEMLINAELDGSAMRTKAIAELINE